MNFDAIIKRVIGIITKPNDEWQVIKDESAAIADLYTKYAIILAAVPAAAGFLGNILIGRSIMGFTVRIPVDRALIWGVLMYVLSLVGVYIMGFIIDALAPSFGSQKDMVSSMKVAVYASTAVWAAGVLYIVPALGIVVMIAGLYGLFLLYLGIKIVKNPPQDKAVGYFVVVIIVAIVVNVLIGIIVAAATFGGAARFM